MLCVLSFALQSHVTNVLVIVTQFMNNQYKAALAQVNILYQVMVPCMD